MKNTKCLIAICLIVALVLTPLTGCRKVITYPDDVYSDIYSDIVIGGNKDSEEEDDDLLNNDILNDDDALLNNNSSDNTTTTTSSGNGVIVDDTYFDDSDLMTEDTDKLGVNITGGKAFYVKDFGAKGDGKTDDGISVNKAINAAKSYTAKNAGKRAEVRFEKDKTYVLKTKDDSVSPGSGLISIYEAENITLVGNNATIQGLPNKGYMLIDRSSKIHVKGLNFNYDTPVAYTAKTISSGGGKAVFEVPKWFADCARKTTSYPTNAFAIKTGGRRDHAYVTTATAVDDTHVEITFTTNTPKAGDYMYLPTPGYSHTGIAFQALHNHGEVTFEDINIWNAAQFVFQVNSNYASINWKNVKLVPKDANASDTVAWRDVIHAKDNRQKLSFDKCIFKGTHDDIFNLANTMCQIVEIEDDNEIRIVGLDYENGEYTRIQEGDTVAIIDPYTGAWYGEAKVSEVIVQTTKNIRIRLDKKFNLVGGEYIYFKDLASPGTTITNCEFEGTYRVKGSTTFENCKFKVLSMWIAYSGQNSRVEGPIPENITFKNCDFKAPAQSFVDEKKGVFSLTCETIGGDPNTEYHIKNIVFDGCTFQYNEMINRANPYITIK